MATDPNIVTQVAGFWGGLLNFRATEISDAFSQLKQKCIVVFAGNRAGKTTTAARQYVMRAFGLHPIAEKNRLARKVRCMSSTLPTGSDADSQDNAQYIELKRLIPPEMIVSDITSRSATLVVKRPPGLGSDKCVFEFRSSKQELQDLGKINISSVWHDEETPRIIREECKYRLLQENGDEIFTVTLTNPLSYVVDDLWNRAGFIFRSRSIVQKLGLPQIEHPKGGNPDIAALQMATDDNPTLDEAAIERLFEEDDDATELLRRYGVPAHVTGRIHKTYNPAVCYIDHDKYFPDGVPYRWLHTRGIDYHESRIPWSIGWLSASPEDEWFLWNEFHPAIDGPNAYNTWDIVLAILRKSGDYIYPLNVIDPLANKAQANTGNTVVQDLNQYTHQIHEDQGLGTASIWRPWDTKGTSGRLEIAKRFKNAVRVGRPFNNMVREKGVARRLPTLWITTRCPHFHKSIINWRYGEYVTSSTRATNDPKATPQQKWSHDNMVLECLAKEKLLLNAAHFISHPPRQAQVNVRSATGR